MYVPKLKQKKVLPRLELGSLDSKSKVLTITPQDHMENLCVYTCVHVTQGVIVTFLCSKLKQRTRIFGFKVQGANHYTTGPHGELVYIRACMLHRVSL